MAETMVEDVLEIPTKSKSLRAKSIEKRLQTERNKSSARGTRTRNCNKSKSSKSGRKDQVNCNKFSIKALTNCVLQPGIDFIHIICIAQTHLRSTPSFIESFFKAWKFGVEHKWSCAQLLSFMKSPSPGSISCIVCPTLAPSAQLLDYFSGEKVEHV